MEKIKVVLNGLEREFPKGVTIREIVEDIDPSLLKDALAAKVDGKLLDLSAPLMEDAELSLLTFDSREGREVYWHTSSHILAQAVKRLFPEAKLGIGPAIEEGFYYDFDVPKPFSPEDLEKIEQEMNRIISEDLKITREERTREDAIEFLNSIGEPYKVKLVKDLESDGKVSFYRQGDFIDLCRGPHAPSTGKIRYVKLLSSSGAYWRGDERNPMLQRIYGISYPTKSQLEDYLYRLEEAKRRDHRVLGRELDLFSIHPEIGAGLIHWHPNGAIIRNTIENFWKEEHFKRGYKLVYTPHIASDEIYKISGHLENYDAMYSAMEIDGQPYRIKPMNCPGHIMIFKTKIRSYRDLPIRYAELGTVYRYEKSGVLHGMLRVRGFTQDDSHIFCTEEQLLDEVRGVLDLVKFMMDTFGYKFKTYLSTRPEKSLGSDEVWEKATGALVQALRDQGLSYEVSPGEGVFYGPKIDVILEDVLGRGWQGPTIQVDFNLPERFDVNYVAPDGSLKRVVMVHRTVLGSMERFIGGLIEHYGGAFPVWLAPVQVMVIPVTDSQLPYAREVAEKLKEASIRAELNDRSAKLGYKIREAEKQKIPYMAVVGRREAEEGRLSIRARGKGDLGSFSLDGFITRVQEDIRERKLAIS